MTIHSNSVSLRRDSSCRNVSKNGGHPYCISVDWFEVCANGSSISAIHEFTIDGRVFYVIKEERQTPFFKDFYIIKHKNLEYAYVRQTPRLDRMKKTLSCVKLANRVLYHENAAKLLLGILNALHLRYQGITRLDIAYDCNRFFDGRLPSKFVKHFVSKPIDSIGGMYLANCKEYSVHGRKSIGNDGSINYIAFGAKSCQKRGYIYNKSLELEEVKDKPWIRDMWERNGLKNDAKNKVWRAEISIRSGGKDLLNMDTGQLFSISPEYLAFHDGIIKLFHYYAAKVFDFRVNEGQKNRRHFTRLNLFDKNVVVTCQPKRVSNLCDSGRSEKMCFNKLKSLSTTYVDLSESIRSSLYAAMEWIQNLSSIKTARYRSEQYKYYLDTFAASRFIAEEDFAYLEALHQASESRQKISMDSQQLYEQYLSFLAAREFIDIF